MSDSQFSLFAKFKQRPASRFLLVIIAALVAYSPTFVQLARGPWQSEQDGHGPLIIAASLWLVWASRRRLRDVEIAPAPIPGWCMLVFGLAILFFARTQDVISLEAFSELPVIVGCVLILAGWEALAILAFPIAFLFFAVPPPGWVVDGATVPLKVLISNWVTEFLYRAGYPIAQNGTIIMINNYQLGVQDACAGMNSIFALSAIGMFYVYAFRWTSKLRAMVLLAAVIPITIFANFLRVMTLVLIAYYGGADLLEGAIHDLTGIALFIFAITLLFLLDGVLGLFGFVVGRFQNWSEPSPILLRP